MIRRLLGIAWEASGRLLVSLACRIVWSATAIALFAVPAWTVGRLLSGQQVDPWPIGGVLVALALLKGGCRYLEQYAGHHAAFELLAAMRLRLYDALAPQAPAVTTRVGSGRLLQAGTRDINRIEVFFAHSVVPAITAVLVPAGGVITIGVICGATEMLICLAGFLVGGLIVPLTARRLSAQSARQVLTERAALSQHVAEDAGAQAEIRSFGAQHRRLAAMRAFESRISRALHRSGAVHALRTAMAAAWPLLTVIALLALARPESLAGTLTAAAIVVAASPVLDSVQRFARTLPLALAAAQRYFDLLDRPPAVPDTDSGSAPAAPLTTGPLEIRLENVTAAYPGSATDALHGIDLHVRTGRRLAVTGPSGAGKTTIARLLVRELDPREGRVLIDGTDVRELPLAQLRDMVTVVEQKAVLVSGSILDNLRLGRPALSRQEAWDALERASLADHVRSLPDRLDAEVGPGGGRLSGGQRQRLALARALARRPRVLILDEATSHQDPTTQRAIRDAIEHLTGITVIVIAHRDDAIEGTDHRIELHSDTASSPNLPTVH